VTGAVGPLFIGSEIYRGSSYGACHPLAIPRVSTVMDLSRALGWLPRDSYRTSPRAKAAALTTWHSPAYVAALEAAEAAQAVDEATRARHGLGTTANPVFPEMFRRPATAAGGSILAGELLMRPGAVFNPGGGTHHGMPDRAGGFCYLNDPALAILALRRTGLRRIAYVDIDAHHPDGVEHGFSRDTGLTLVSVHEERRWPFTGGLRDRGAGTVWNLPVPKAFNDTEFEAVLNEVILPIVAAARPEAIILQCGADAVEEDPLSRLSLSNQSHFRAVAALRLLAPRMLVLGGGGYNPWSVARLWTGVWGVLSGREMPDRLPAPAAEVLSRLHWPRKPRLALPAPWVTTLADAPRPGPLRDEVRARIVELRSRAEVWA
jgi:acetoin utilization protein AcuC